MPGAKVGAGGTAKSRLRQTKSGAASDVRELLKLGMSLSSERFAQAICARLGIRRNTGKRRVIEYFQSPLLKHGSESLRDR